MPRTTDPLTLEELIDWLQKLAKSQERTTKTNVIDIKITEHGWASSARNITIETEVNCE
jgi:hypothetical protein